VARHRFAFLFFAFPAKLADPKNGKKGENQKQKKAVSSRRTPKKSSLKHPRPQRSLPWFAPINVFWPFADRASCC